MLPVSHPSAPPLFKLKSRACIRPQSYLLIRRKHWRIKANEFWFFFHGICQLFFTYINGHLLTEWGDSFTNKLFYDRHWPFLSFFSLFYEGISSTNAHKWLKKFKSAIVVCKTSSLLSNTPPSKKHTISLWNWSKSLYFCWKTQKNATSKNDL